MQCWHADNQQLADLNLLRRQWVFSLLFFLQGMFLEVDADVCSIAIGAGVLNMF